MTTTTRTGWHGARLALIAVVASAVVTALAINTRQGTATAGQVVPGHTRPAMTHDWPHPRDFTFAPGVFQPPDVKAAAFKTVSGVRAFIVPGNLERVVRVTVAIPLGRLYELPEEAGAADYLAQVLMHRNTAGDAGQLAARLEAMGLPSTWFQGGLNLMTRPFSGEEAAGAAPPEVKQLPDGTSLSLEVLPQDWRAALDLLASLVRRPGLDDADVRAYRTGSPYTMPLTNPGATGFRPKIELERTLAGYPLAPPEAGRSLTPAAVRALAARSTGRDQVVFGIGGNVPRPEVERALNALTEGWPAAPTAPRLAATPRAAAGPRPMQLIEADGIPGGLGIGRVIDPVPDGDQAPLAVMAEILDTRLNIATREMRGLTNRDMFVLPESISGAGLVAALSGGRPESIAPLIKVSLEEIARIQASDATVTDEELERAKGTLVLGRWQAALDGAPQAASTYALEAMRRGSIDWLLRWPEAVRSVTAEQVRGVAQKYVPTADLTTAVVGPIDAIRRARHPRWPAALDEIASESHAGHGGSSR